MDFSQFHFLRPEWFLALIPLALLLWAFRYLQQQRSGWQGVVAGHLYQKLITSKQGKGRKPPLSLLALGWLLAVVALAGPTWERLPQPVYQLHTGKVVLMDMSMSMRATDVTPDRLTRAKYKAIDLVNEIAEGEIGLIAYAGDAFLISPLTSDAQNLTTLIPSLSPEIMPAPGSDAFLGVKKAIELLSNAGYQQGDIFWITDGIETQQVKEISDLIQGQPYRLSVLGVGTEDGAPIQLTNGDLLKDNRGAIVVPKLQDGNLKLLTQKGKGLYAPLQADDSDIEYLANQQLLSRETEQNNEESQDNFGDQWKEMGPYLLLLLLPVAAYGFRRGLLNVFALVILLPLSSPEASADWWDDMWKTRDQQGQQAFNQQDFAGAAEHFDDPMWQGSAYYRNGDYAAAAEAFSQSDSPQAQYNLGNALAQLGQTEEAIAAYDKVLQQQPDHADAAANKALLEQQQQQQQQQEQEQNQQNNDAENQTGEGTQDQQQNDQQQQQEGEQPDAEEQQKEQQQAEQQQGEGEPQQQQAQPQELTEEEKEQMQKMENWLRKVPDDPAYLLKRKMQLDYQQRRRQTVPNKQQRNW